jgi:hypothetical protein
MAESGKMLSIQKVSDLFEDSEPSADEEELKESELFLSKEQLPSQLRQSNDRASLLDSSVVSAE